MAVPARRTSKMRKNTRRSHDALIFRTTTSCLNCGSVILPHHACMKCYTYKGEKIPTSKKNAVFTKESTKGKLNKVAVSEQIDSENKNKVDDAKIKK